MTGRLRDDPDFRRYWLARVLSITGSVATAVVLPVLVYRMSGSTFLTALVAGLSAGAYLLTGLFAGALTDRWNRRRVMVASDLVSAVLVGSVPLAHAADALTVAHVLAVALGVQIVNTFFDGANFGALPTLVGKARLPQASAAVWSVASVVDLSVPAVAGLALAVLSPATLLLVDGLSFIASALAIRGIRRALSEPREGLPPLRPRVVLSDIGDGLRFLVRHPGVRTMTVIGTLQSFAGAGVVALMVVWTDQVLRVGTAGVRFGLVFGAWGTGGLVASLALPWLLKRYPPAAITLFALPISAVLGVLTTLATTWYLGAIGLLGWGSVYVLVILNSITYRQQETPEHLLGRVNMAGRMLSWGVGWSLGSLAAGALAEFAGIRTTMLCTAAFGLVAVAVAWTSPLRGIAAGVHQVQSEKQSIG